MKELGDNIVLLTDSYKISHYKQYPKGTTNIYSYFESRGGEFDEVVFFGLQYFLKRYLSQIITKEDIDEAEELLTAHLGPGVFERSKWEYIIDNHGGKLPVRIKAAPEGTVIPTSNVMMTIENTDPECFWLTNYLETILVQVWYPSTVATISREQKKVIHAALVRSGNPDLIDFKLHDFGFRGVETVESAGIGGLAHLVNFKGTDNIAALILGKKHYGCDMAGFSIPAAEHSTITSWGKDGEADAMRNLITQYPEGLVAGVSDSWDFRNAVDNIWGKELKEEVLNRKGTVVVRPDSGDMTEENVYASESFYKNLGGKINEKGYKVIDEHISQIQGDGINRRSTPKFLDNYMDAGFSMDNLALGSGGGLLQDCNRDTSKYAFKAANAVVNGEQRDIYKQPKTAAWKSSKKGRMKLIIQDGQYKTVGESDDGVDVLQAVFENGEALIDQNLDDIRERATIIKPEAVTA